MADKVVIHVDEMREFISRMLGVAAIASLLPSFLRGRNMNRMSIWLSKEDLGGWEPFHTTWTELCDSRNVEAKEMDKHFAGDGSKAAPGLDAMLVRALEKYTHEDEEIAAGFYAIFGGETLDDLADKYGINYEDESERRRREYERRIRNLPE
ncbi:MAG: hypothetical protein ACRD1T_01705 [Acidimicrobiia bacterium]